MKIPLKLKKYIKKIYKKDNKIEKQYLLIDDGHSLNHFLISSDGTDFSASTSKTLILDVIQQISGNVSIYIVHNHPGFRAKPDPSILDRENQIFIESVLNVAGKNMDDYLIYGGKKFYSFAECDDLYTGLKNRTNKKVLKARHTFDQIDIHTILKNKQFLHEMMGNKQEMLLTSKKILISDAFPIQKTEEILENELDVKILFIRSNEQSEKRYTFYKQIFSFDEIFTIDERGWVSSVDLDYFKKQRREDGK